MATYELYLDDPLGNRLAVLDHFTKLEWTRAINDVGELSLTFGGEQIDWLLFGLDRRVEVWRIADTGLSRLVRTYFLRWIARDTDADGRETITMGGPDYNYLLSRRIVDADSGSAGASKSAPADDMIKAIARENLGDLANVDRDLSPYGFEVAPDYSLAPTLTKEFCRRNVLTVCQDIASESGDQGTPLYFDIVTLTPTTMKLRTWIERRGADKTSTRTPFSLLRGTLASATLTRDWSQEVNHVYAAGQGTEAERKVIHVEDKTAIGASSFNRSEMLAEGSIYTTTASLTSYGRTVLRENRAKYRFQATLADAPGSRFQLDWDFGDLIAAEYDEEIFPCEVAAIHGTVTPDSETIEVRLDYYA